MSDLSLLPAALLGLLAGGSLVGLWLRYSQRDAVALLIVYLALLFVLPSAMVLGPLGAVGSPSILVGLGIAAVWLTAKVVPDSGLDRGPQPVRTALFVYAAVMMASYANGQLRPLTELEQSTSTRMLMWLACLLGIALLTADGVRGRERLDTLLRWLLVAAGFLALIGVVQFLTAWDPTVHFRLPGLTLNHELNGTSTRSLFNRPWGTSQHPIEFGVVLGALLPLALHFAFHAKSGRPQVLHWGLVLLMAAGMAMSVSRSGVVAAGVAMLVMALAWSWRRRLNALIGAVAFTAGMWAVVPGLVGTLQSLFLNAGSDPSIVARRDRVPVIMELVAEHPWLGHGFGTFSVEDFLLVDNQFYTSAISTGWVGLAVFLALVGFAAFVALDVRRFSVDAETRHLAVAIAAGLFSLFVCMYTFDAFTYRQFMSVMFLLTGAGAALWRIERARRGHDHRPASAAAGALETETGKAHA